jgi:hypothetical protein
MQPIDLKLIIFARVEVGANIKFKQKSQDFLLSWLF